jgi:hypothetical protein
VVELIRFSYDVLTNMVGDLIFAVGLAVIAIVVSNVLWRRALRAFFGITGTGRSAIKVRLSCINVIPGGARATDEIVEGFVGPAMSELEYKYALQLTRVVQRRPIVRVISALMEGTQSTSIDPVLCEIGSSPPHDGETPVDFESDPELANRLQRHLGAGTYVLIGEPMYNLLTGYAMSQAPSRFTFVGGRTPDDEQGRTIRVDNVYHATGNPVAEDYERKREDGVYIEYGILERIADWNGSTVFVCAGTSTASTIAALRELAEWRDLHGRFDTGPPTGGSFGVLLEVRVIDREAVPEPQEVLERWCYPPATLSGRR